MAHSPSPFRCTSPPRSPIGSRLTFSSATPESPWGSPGRDDLVLRNCSAAGVVRKHVAWLPDLVEKSPSRLQEPIHNAPSCRGVLKAGNSSRLLKEMLALSEEQSSAQHGSDSLLGRELVRLMRKTVADLHALETKGMQTKLQGEGATAYAKLAAMGIVPSMTGRANYCEEVDEFASDIDVQGRTPGHTPDAQSENGSQDEETYTRQLIDLKWLTRAWYKWFELWEIHRPKYMQIKAKGVTGYRIMALRRKFSLWRNRLDFVLSLQAEQDRFRQRLALMKWSGYTASNDASIYKHPSARLPLALQVQLRMRSRKCRIGLRMLVAHAHTEHSSRMLEREANGHFLLTAWLRWHFGVAMSNARRRIRENALDAIESQAARSLSVAFCKWSSLSRWNHSCYLASQQFTIRRRRRSLDLSIEDWKKACNIHRYQQEVLKRSFLSLRYSQKRSSLKAWKLSHYRWVQIKTSTVETARSMMRRRISRVWESWSAFKESAFSTAQVELRLMYCRSQSQFRKAWCVWLSFVHRATCLSYMLSENAGELQRRKMHVSVKKWRTNSKSYALHVQASASSIQIKRSLYLWIKAQALRVEHKRKLDAWNIYTMNRQFSMLQAAWRCVVQDGKRQHHLRVRVIKFLQHSCLHRGMSNWRSRVRRASGARASTSVAIRHNLSYRVTQNLETWCENAAFERQARSGIASAVGHFRSRKLMRSLRSWSAMRRASRGRLQMLRATRELVRARRRRDALQLWANACSGRVRALHAMRSAALWWVGRSLRGCWRVLLALFVRRRLNRILVSRIARSFRCWVDHGSSMARLARVNDFLSRCAHHRSRRQLRHGMTTWSGRSAMQERVRDRIDRIVCALGVRSVSRSWHVWLSTITWCRHGHGLTARALRVRHSRSIRHVWHNWLNFASLSKVAVGLAARAARSFRFRGLRQGWNSWRCLAAVSRATRRVTARVVFVLTNENIARACKIWQEFHRLKLLQLGRVAHSIASYRKQHRLRALRRWSYMRVLGNIRTRVSVRCEAGVARRAYANWHMVAQLWATVRRVLCRLTRRAVWHAFDAWRADTAVVSRVRKLTYRGINQTVWWAFLIWQEASQQTKAASRALTRASTKLWSVELPQYVKVWRERASFERQARSSVTSAVGHFRSRKLMRSLRSWSAMRRASRVRLQMLRATRELVRARRRRDALQLWANACSGRVRALHAMRSAALWWVGRSLRGCWRVLLALFVRRRLNRILVSRIARSFRCWVDHGSSMARLARVNDFLSRCAHHRSRRQLRHGMTTWSGRSAMQERVRDRIDRIVCALGVRSVSRSWHVWLSTITWCRHGHGLTARALRVRHSRSIRHVWHNWLNFASLSKVAVGLAARAARSFRFRGLRQGWNSWRCLAAMSRATRRVTARVVFVLTNENIARACKIWQEFHRLKLLQLGRVAHSIASYRKQHRLRALRRWSYMRVLGNIRTRVSVRCEAGVARRAYANWRMVAQLWATVRRVLCRLTRRAVWHAFDAWRADTAVVSRVRKLTYRGINQTVWWAFLIWQEASQQTKAASRALTRASTKLWSVELPQYVKVWRERASFERQARSSVTSAVGHFRSRKLMRSLRSWSAMRRASRGRLQMLRATRELVRARRRRDALQLWANACSGRVRALHAMRSAALWWVGRSLRRCFWFWKTVALMIMQLLVRFRQWALVIKRLLFSKSRKQILSLKAGLFRIRVSSQRFLHSLAFAAQVGRAKNGLLSKTVRISFQRAFSKWEIRTRRSRSQERRQSQAIIHRGVSRWKHSTVLCLRIRELIHRALLHLTAQAFASWFSAHEKCARKHDHLTTRTDAQSSRQLIHHWGRWRLFLRTRFSRGTVSRVQRKEILLRSWSRWIKRAARCSRIRHSCSELKKHQSRSAMYVWLKWLRSSAMMTQRMLQATLLHSNRFCAAYFTCSLSKTKELALLQRYLASLQPIILIKYFRAWNSIATSRCHMLRRMIVALDRLLLRTLLRDFEFWASHALRCVGVSTFWEASYKRRIHSLFNSWCSIIEIERTLLAAGLRLLRRRLGMTFACWVASSCVRRQRLHRLDAAEENISSRLLRTWAKASTIRMAWKRFKSLTRSCRHRRHKQSSECATTLAAENVYTAQCIKLTEEDRESVEKLDFSIVPSRAHAPAFEHEMLSLTGEGDPIPLSHAIVRQSLIAEYRSTEDRGQVLLVPNNPNENDPDRVTLISRRPKTYLEANQVTCALRSIHSIAHHHDSVRSIGSRAYCPSRNSPLERRASPFPAQRRKSAYVVNQHQERSQSAEPCKSRQRKALEPCEANESCEALNALKKRRERCQFAKPCHARARKEAESGETKGSGGAKELCEPKEPCDAKKSYEVNVPCKPKASCEAKESCETKESCEAKKLCKPKTSCEAQGSCEATGPCKPKGTCDGEKSCDAKESCEAKGQSKHNGACEGEVSCDAKESCNAKGLCKHKEACEAEGSCEAEESCRGTEVTETGMGEPVKQCKQRPVTRNNEEPLSECACKIVTKLRRRPTASPRPQSANPRSSSISPVRCAWGTKTRSRNNSHEMVKGRLRCHAVREGPPLAPGYPRSSSPSLDGNH